MDPTVAVLLEQIKAQLEDELRKSIFIDPETGKGSWSLRAVEKALSESIPDTGTGSFDIDEPHQPTYAQWVDHHKDKLKMARDRLEDAARFSPNDWEYALEDYDHAEISFLLAVKGMCKRGAQTMVDDVVLTTIKFQPPMPAEFIELSFDVGEK